MGYWGEWRLEESLMLPTDVALAQAEAHIGRLVRVGFAVSKVRPLCDWCKD